MINIKDKNVKFIIKFTVSALLIFLVLRYIGINKVITELSKVNLSYIFFALLATIPLILLKALRWKAIIGGFGVDIKFSDSVKFTIMAISFSLITPAKIGEFVKTKYLVDKTKIRYLRSFVTVFIDKGFDIVAMVFLALIGLSLLEEFLRWSDLFIATFFTYVIVLVLVFVFFDKFISLIPLFFPKKYKERFKNINLTRKIYLSSIVVSLGVWIILSAQAFLILNSLGVAASLFITITVVPLMALSSLVPFSLGGIGIRELIAISFLLLIGITPEKSAVFSLLYTFISSGITAIIGGFLHIFYKKKPDVK